MQYRSTHTGYPKDFPKDVARELADHLQGWEKIEKKGQLQDALLAFRFEGDRLLINMLEPVYVLGARTTAENLIEELDRWALSAEPKKERPTTDRRGDVPNWIRSGRHG